MVMTPRALALAAVVPLVLAATAATAAADGFGGFGGREDGYLVGRDRICKPLVIQEGRASGTPICQKASADEVAHLSVKPAKAVRGRDATHTAAARGRTLEIAARETVVVRWDSADPISKVVDLYLSTYGNLVAVELQVRRGGRDVTEVVAFDLRTARGGKGGDPAGEPGKEPGTGGKAAPEPPARTLVDPPAPTAEVTKAVKAARKASTKKALAAWQKVLALDPDHSEARYGVAVAQARAKKLDLAIAALEALAASNRSDAVEFLVAARFDKAFAALRADLRFRAATGLDQEGTTFYERVMGHGGTWEQAGTSCDTPQVILALARDRSFKLTVKSVCSGRRFEDTFRGTWTLEEPTLTLVLPNKGRDDEHVPCRVEADGDEDAIRCDLDADLSFVVRPVRR